MACPIEECRFASNTKYQRHWDEQHVEVTTSYSCAVRFANRYADDARI